MNIDVVKVGIYQTNCYIISNELECLIIDPGDQSDLIIKNIKKKVIGIIITHSHFDHIGAVDALKDFYNVPVYDYSNLKEGQMKIGNFKFEVIYTKGHIDDAITLYFKDYNLMFVGDFLFKGGIGRIDLDRASSIDMKKSLMLIRNYPDDIVIYPGHGDKTILGNEKKMIDYYIKVL